MYVSRKWKLVAFTFFRVFINCVFCFLKKEKLIFEIKMLFKVLNDSYK